MLPVLVLFTFDSPVGQVILYLLAVGLVAYAAYSGWKGAESRAAAPTRAIGYGIFGAVVAKFAVDYAKVNGAPLHTYGLMIAGGFSLAVWLSAREGQRACVGTATLSDGTVVPMGEFMREVVMDVAFYCLIAGLGGAHLLFIIVNWDTYLPYFQTLGSDLARFQVGAAAKDVLDIVTGGLVFYGAFLGGAGVVYWYMKKHKIEFLRFADLCIPNVSIAHAIGRFGCLSAGCCWGGFADPHSPVSKLALLFPGHDGAPWGQSSLAFQSQFEDHRLLDSATHQLLTQLKPTLDTANHFLGTWIDQVTGAVLSAPPAGAIDIAVEAARLNHTLPVYPTQLMESVGELIIFGILLSIRRVKHFHGQVFASWLMMYSVLRSTVEMFRGDEERGRILGWLATVPRSAWYNVSTSQFVSIAIFATGAALWVRYGRRADLPLGALPAT